MMSGDSPNSHNKDIFDFKEGRTTPTPTTSQVSSKQDAVGQSGATELVTASVLVEPLKDRGPDDILNPETRNKHNDESIATAEEVPLRDKHDDINGSTKKINGDVDHLDATWMPPRDLKREEPEDESCGVKCLYYSIQCCECTIM